MFFKKKEDVVVTESNGNIKPKENYSTENKYSIRDSENEGIYLGKLIRRLKGINGQWNIAVRRYKNENPEKGNAIEIKKRLLVYISIPIIRDIEILTNKISDLGEMTVSKGKIYIDNTEIEGIKLLCGVISVKNENSIAYISYAFLNRILKLMFDDNSVKK